MRADDDAGAVANAALEKLQNFCRVELPRHTQPARFDVRSSLPRLPSGKYDLRELLGDLSFVQPEAEARSASR
jgi:hypothetical protein